MLSQEQNNSLIQDYLGSAGKRSPNKTEAKLVAPSYLNESRGSKEIKEKKSNPAVMTLYNRNMKIRKSAAAASSSSHQSNSFSTNYKKSPYKKKEVAYTSGNTVPLPPASRRPVTQGSSNRKSSNVTPKARNPTKIVHNEFHINYYNNININNS